MTANHFQIWVEALDIGDQEIYHVATIVDPATGAVRTAEGRSEEEAIGAAAAKAVDETWTCLPTTDGRWQANLHGAGVVANGDTPLLALLRVLRVAADKSAAT